MHDLVGYRNRSNLDFLDSPRVEIGRDLLGGLPKPALLLFATRCARRVGFFVDRTDAPAAAASKCLDAIDKHIAEDFDASEVVERDKRPLVDAVMRFAESAERDVSPRWYALVSAVHVIDCLEQPGLALHWALQAARQAHEAALAGVGSEVVEFDKAMRQDAIDLLEATFRNSWTDDSRAIRVPTLQTISLLPRPQATSVPRILGVSSGLSISSLLSARHLQGTPQNGLLVLTARSLMRAIEPVDQRLRLQIFASLRDFGTTASNGWGDPLLPLSESLCDDASLLAGYESPEPKLKMAIARSVYAFGRALRCSWADAADQTETFARTALVFADEASRLRGRLLTPDIIRDVEAFLHLCAQQQAAHGYSGGRRVPFDGSALAIGFATHLAFNLEAPVPSGTIGNMVTEVETSLISALARNPRRLHELEPSAFEALVGRLFERFGFQVEFTKRTRDGGRDIIAVSCEPVQAKYLIECKRYRTKKVGIDIVQRLHGVRDGEGGTLGIVATTSTFTKPALTWIDNPRVRLNFEPRDFDGIVGWLLLADRLALAKAGLGSALAASPFASADPDFTA